MTFSDLLKLMRRHLRIVIAFPVAFLIISLAWSMFTQASYTATASFVTNGDLALAQGLASKEASSYSNADVRVTCASVATSKQITISATGNTPSVCVESANNVANAAVRQYKEANNAIIASVSEASFATSNAPSISRAAILPFVMGFLLAICIVIVIDMVKLPVKSQRDAQVVSGLPILGTAPSAEGGERLLANLQFRCNGRPSTIAIVPVGTETTAPVAARELAAALEHNDVRVKLVKGSPHAKKFQVSVPEDAAIVVSCEPLDAGMGAAYIAHNADVTVLCVSEWTDSKRQLASTVGELELAGASIAGIAYLPEEKKPREPRRPKDPEGE